MFKKFKIKILELLVKNSVNSFEKAIRMDVYEERLMKEIGIENKTYFYKILYEMERGKAITRVAHGPTNRVYVYMTPSQYERVKKLLPILNDLELVLGLILVSNKDINRIVDTLLQKIYEKS